MPETKNAAASWRAPGTGSPTSATRPCRSATTCTFCPDRCFLPENTPVVAVAFADRSEEPVHEHTVALGAVMLLVDLGAGHPPQDRVQHVVVSGDGGL